MAAAGVPGARERPDVTTAQLPVLVKASAGGGGREVREWFTNYRPCRPKSKPRREA